MQPALNVARAGSRAGYISTNTYNQSLVDVVLVENDDVDFESDRTSNSTGTRQETVCEAVGCAE